MANGNKRKNYAEIRKDAGMCVSCGRNKPAFDRVQCVDCLDKSKLRNERRKKAVEGLGTCRNHPGVPVKEDKQFCKRCLDYFKFKKKLTVEERKNLGKCTRHPDVEAEPGHTLCEECMQHQRNVRRKNRQDRLGSGFCLKHPDVPAMAQELCDECWFKEIARKSLKSVELSTEIKQLLYAQGFTCAISGRPLIIGENASIDHIIPRSRGGTNDISNLQWVDFTVNKMKGDLLEEELILYFKAILANSSLPVCDRSSILVENGYSAKVGRSKKRGKKPSTKLKMCNCGAVANAGSLCSNCWLRNKANQYIGGEDGKLLLMDLFDAQENKCYYTGLKLVPGFNASVDHIVPISKGGKRFEVSNLRVVTFVVNRMKGSLSHEEFLKTCQDLLDKMTTRDATQDSLAW